MQTTKVDHSKVLFGVKKERNQCFCWWSKVFLDKGMANRTIAIGQSLLRVDFNQKKGRGKLSSLWLSCTAGDVLLAIVSGFGFDVAACAPLCLRRGIRVRPCSLRLCVYLPCGLQVQPLDLSWPCLLRALRWGLVRDRCESVRVGIQRSCVGIQRGCVRRKQ